jgi:hypothetical protein
MNWIKVREDKKFVANFRILFQNLPLILRKHDTHLTELNITHLRAEFWISCRPEFELFFFLTRLDPIPGHGLPLRGFVITLFGHTTLGRTSLDEWSARRRDLYLIRHNARRKQTSMPSAGLEPAIPWTERPQTHALDRAATGIFTRVSRRRWSSG